MDILNKLKQPTLILSLAGALKLILQLFGINIPDQTINAFVDGICALITIAGIIIDHGKQGTQPTANPPVQKDTSAPV